jgi:hypothetical protein
MNEISRREQGEDFVPFLPEPVVDMPFPEGL